MPTTPNSKLPYPAATDPADVPTDLSKLALALDEIAYAQITASVTVTATAEASATTVVAAPAVTFDGTTIVIIEFFARSIATALVVGANISMILYQDGASLGHLAQLNSGTAGGQLAPVFAARRLTPPAGSHTYSITSIVAGGNGTVHAGPGGVGQLLPAYIRIKRA